MWGNSERLLRVSLGESCITVKRHHDTSRLEMRDDEEQIGWEGSQSFDVFWYTSFLTDNTVLFWSVGSHTSQRPLLKPRCGICHGSQVTLPKWFSVMDHNLSPKIHINTVFCAPTCLLDFWSPEGLLEAQKSHSEPPDVVSERSRLPKFRSCHGGEGPLPKCWIHKTCHSHSPLPNRSK